MFLKKIHVLSAPALMMFLQSAFAVHPLVSDDTNTQDIGNQQLEVNTDWLKKQGVFSHVADVTYTYGLLANVDLMSDLPSTLSSPRGVNDGSFGIKWRFYEHGPISFAVKPVLVLASGNQNRGLGTGRNSGALTLIGTVDMAPWAFSGNVGVYVNRYALAPDRQNNRSNLWRASASVSYSLTPKLSAVADIGIARNPDVTSTINPAFVVTGLIYSPNKDVDLDTGFKFGLNNAEVRHQVGIGLTWRF
ncbi:transporter [Glaciimonas sp. PAMC28666]|uniref:transporter n=1 Tax=Glaciimonas sp. PAMC28666 TaxID=2807626 RepID=UPI00196670BF|nr:transporter [Glaciimonas sp. PAMC28666]QRX83551.1 transporter [Glaciimonas sp. PAMC28666]